MVDEKEIKKLLEILVTNLKDDLAKHPYFLLNEHDLQAYLYSKMIKERFCNKYIIDGDNDENYLLHCEYSRGYYKNEKFSGGRLKWDMAILKEDMPGKHIDWDKKPVFIGFELKSNIDENYTKIKNDILSEENAVQSVDGNNPYADWAVVFHINIGKEKNKSIYEKVKKFIEKQKIKNSKTFYIYVESYKDFERPKHVLL